MSPANDISLVCGDKVHILNGDSFGPINDYFSRTMRGVLEAEQGAPDVDASESRPLGLRSDGFQTACWVKNDLESRPYLEVVADVSGDPHLMTLEPSDSYTTLATTPVRDDLSGFADQWGTCPLLRHSATRLCLLSDSYPSPFSSAENLPRRPTKSTCFGISVAAIGKIILISKAGRLAVALETESHVSCLCCFGGDDSLVVVAGLNSGSLDAFRLNIDFSVGPLNRLRSFSFASLKSPDSRPLSPVNFIDGNGSHERLMLCFSVANAANLATLDLADQVSIRLSSTIGARFTSKIVGIAFLADGACYIATSDGKVSTLKDNLEISTIFSTNGVLLGMTTSVNRLQLITATYKLIAKIKRIELACSKCLVSDLSDHLARSLLGTPRSLWDFYLAIGAIANKTIPRDVFETLDFETLQPAEAVVASLARCGLTTPKDAFQSLPDQILQGLTRGLHFVYWREFRAKSVAPGALGILFSGQIIEREALFRGIVAPPSSESNCIICGDKMSFDLPSRSMTCGKKHSAPICHSTGKVLDWDLPMRCPMCESHTLSSENHLCSLCYGCKLVSLR